MKLRLEMNNKLVLFVAFVFVLNSCNTRKKPEETQKPVRTVQVPAFNADSAYFFVDKQVKFGPRVPNTKAHQQTADWFVNQLKKSGATVTVQAFEALTWDNQKVQLKNIIASFNASAQKRVLLAAHWDTRPYADKDKEKKDAPFDGANDGASGVGILLEIARVIGQNKAPQVGVDLILFDGEDWGEKEDEDSKLKMPSGYEKWWCLGSQYWSKHKHQKGYNASFGILLDMVGSKHAQFFREGASLEYAPGVVEKVWNTATRLGYTDYFIKTNVAGITDDHVFVNEMGKIPMIDIVHYQSGVGFFGDYHHSRKDNLSIISKETLSAVGTTLMNVLYYEE
ncbi:glutamine cyclotransferase [Cytophagales bacterium WSM2-2]|nr:glutamine cyclotransferase [Cytophagales bacterium WSM2-2]